jgi:hypothetical protein
MLDSLTPAEIRTAVLAQMLEEGPCGGRWAEAYMLYGPVAQRLGSGWGRSGMPEPGPYGSRRKEEAILNRYNGRVTRALESLAASGDLVKVGKDQPGPNGVTWSGVQYWVPAAYEKEKRTAEIKADAAAAEKLRWERVAVRLLPFDIMLKKDGSLSLDDWEHLLEATGL